MASSKSQGMSSDTKTLVTVLLLVFAFPAGFVLMWVWTSWPKWVKFLISGIFAFFMLIWVLIFAAAILVSVNPQAQLDRAEEARMQYESKYQESIQEGLDIETDFSN